MAKDNCRYTHSGLWCLHAYKWTTKGLTRTVRCHRQPDHEGQHHGYAQAGPCFTWNNE